MNIFSLALACVNNVHLSAWALYPGTCTKSEQGLIDYAKTRHLLDKYISCNRVMKSSLQVKPCSYGHKRDLVWQARRKKCVKTSSNWTNDCRAFGCILTANWWRGCWLAIFSHTPSHIITATAPAIQIWAGSATTESAARETNEPPAGWAKIRN